MNTVTSALAGLLLALSQAGAQEAASPLERYRKLEFPPLSENFDRGWQERVALEFDVVNHAELESLRAALKDPDPIVRSIAGRTLGIRGDQASADALATLVESDPESMVRIRAVESLGLLKRRPEVLARAMEDHDLAVKWAARLSAGQLESETDHAAVVRKAFAAGIRRETMGSARVGQPAPDFTALTLEGAPFALASVLGKKPIAMYFAAYDG